MLEDDPTRIPEIDSTAPWTIKGVSSTTRAGMMLLAKDANCTVAALLSRLVREALNEPGDSVADPDRRVVEARRVALPDAMRATAMLTHLGQSGIPVQKQVGYLANRLVKRVLTDALGIEPKPANQLPPPRRKKRIEADAESMAD